MTQQPTRLIAGTSASRGGGLWSKQMGGLGARARRRMLWRKIPLSQADGVLVESGRRIGRRICVFSKTTMTAQLIPRCGKIHLDNLPRSERRPRQRKNDRDYVNFGHFMNTYASGIKNNVFRCNKYSDVHQTQLTTRTNLEAGKSARLCKFLSFCWYLRHQ